MSTSFASAPACSPPRPPALVRLPASFRPSEHHPSHGFAFEFVREIAAEDLRRKVTSLLSAERARCRNPIVRQGANWGRDILSAVLAADREVALPGLRE